MTQDYPLTPSFRLDGKRALVTGAGRGIGLACATALAQAGAAVTLVARNADEIGAAASLIRDAGHHAEALCLDVADPDAPKRLEEAGPYDVLVNNAGTNRPARFADVTPEDFDVVF